MSATSKAQQDVRQATEQYRDLVSHRMGPFDVVTLTYPCSCGGAWRTDTTEPTHVNPTSGTRT